MGVKPFLVASSIQAVMAQRLIRVLCKECKELDPNPDHKLLSLVGLKPHEAEGRVYKAVGCPVCTKTGYKGRKAIFEMMSMNGQIRDMAFKGASIEKIRAAAIANGMRSLAGDGRIKVLKGETSPAEIARVTLAND
jgi:type II secretory ATPase GspE/PulE/Tfp pilus assembly ATPase PilB-like protein